MASWEVVVIESTDDESCCSCNTSNVRLHKWADELRDGQEHQHCDLCYATDFGSRCRSKMSGYGDAMDIMRHMIQLEHLRRASDERE